MGSSQEKETAEGEFKAHHPGQQSFLIVFDFDHTMVDCNTDEVIPNYLGRTEVQERLVQDHMQWTTVMDTLVAPFTPAELREAAKKSVTVDPDMPKVFEFFQALRSHDAASLLDINIASDSNLLFIDAALEGCLPGVRDLITQIHSNPYEEVLQGSEIVKTDPMGETEAERDAAYNEGKPRRSRLHWYEPHQCQRCLDGKKPNMCKSRIIHRLLQTTTLIDPTIIFIGDGRNDYCTVQHALRPRDYIFARRDFPLHQTLSEEMWGCCHVKLWKNAAELLSHFRQVITLAARLPTNVRLRDIHANEFRTDSLLKRIPSILSRLVEANRDSMTPEGIRRMEELIESAKSNGPVPLLPGTTAVPAWMNNFASVSEYDTKERAAARDERPRWGQLPWLHGEIYLYHLVWQYIMLKDCTEMGKASNSTVNQITPFVINNPLYTLDCHGIAENLSSLMAHNEENFDTGFLLLQRLLTGVELGGAAAGVKRYAELLPTPGDGLLPPTAECFQPYRDIFIEEKVSVTVCFMDKRIVPMIACVSWRCLSGEKSAGSLEALEFLPTLLRWMLWGNGVDLSMFTLEELAGKHADTQGTGDQCGTPEEEIKRRRHAEAELMESMETFLVGNQTAELQAYMEALVKGQPPTTERTAAFRTNHIDIIMDNVGVEMVGDLLFGLWFISNSIAEGREAPTVTYHVKPMPYYVSDVTPPDFFRTLTLLQEVVDEGRDFAGKFSASEREAVKEFITLVKGALASGSFKIASDMVWTQPSEYRDLPPRAINRYFFKQRVVLPKSSGETSSPTHKNPDLAAIYAENKLCIEPLTALLIFKGDLNYRRLIGDRHWCRTDFLLSLSKESNSVQNIEVGLPKEHAANLAPLLADTPESHVMEGESMRDIVAAFWPSKFIAVSSIRTIKSECCVGVSGQTKCALDEVKGLGWRISGKYGLVLLSS